MAIAKDINVQWVNYLESFDEDGSNHFLSHHLYVNYLICDMKWNTATPYFDWMAYKYDCFLIIHNTCYDGIVYQSYDEHPI